MADLVYNCCVLWNSDCIFKFQNDPDFIDGEGANDLKQSRAVSFRNWQGDRLPAAAFPKRLFGLPLETDFGEAETYNELPNLIWSIAVLVSRQAADIIEGFNLGFGALYPIELIYHDGKTPMEGEYFVLNFGNAISGYLPSQSPVTNVNQWALGYFTVPNPNLDYNIALSSKVLLGSDIWVDPNLQDVFFVRGGLAEALIAAGMQNDFQFRRCKIVDNVR